MPVLRWILDGRPVVAVPSEWRLLIVRHGDWTKQRRLRGVGVAEESMPGSADGGISNFIRYQPSALRATGRGNELARILLGGAGDVKDRARSRREVHFGTFSTKKTNKLVVATLIK